MDSGNKDWFMQFVVSDWIADPKLSLCKESTRGIWIDALCQMFMLDGCGQLDGAIADLARLCRTSPNAMRLAIEDLKARGAADVTLADENVTLVNRRMRRDYNLRVSARQRKRKQRTGNVVPPDVPPDVTEKSQPNNYNNNHIPLNPPPGDSASFDLFWAAWPQHHRKVNKQKCRDVWVSAGCDANSAAILASLDASKKSAQWTSEGGKYVPAPLVWLNQRRWEAPPPPSKSVAMSSPELKAKIDAEGESRRRRIAEQRRRETETAEIVGALEPDESATLLAEFLAEHPAIKATAKHPAFHAWLWERKHQVQA